MRNKVNVLLVIIFVLCSVTASFGEVLTVRADFWLPYNGSPEAPKPGYMIDVLKEIFEPNGITVDYKLQDWALALEAVNKGEFDAVVGTDDEEAPGFVFPEEEFGMMTNAFFVRIGTKFEYQSIDDLQGLKLGVINGYSYNEDIDAYVAKNLGSDNVHEVTGDDALPSLLEKLVAKEIDVIIEDTNVMAYAMGRHDVRSVIQADLMDEPYALYVAFSPNKKNSKMHAELFDDGIKKLRSSGRLKEILSRYLQKDWK